MTSNILNFLADRSYARNPKRHKVYSSITPSSTIANIKHSSLNFKVYKFTDKGDILLGITRNCTALVAFKYMGIDQIANIYTLTSGEGAFQRMFKEHFVVNLCYYPESSLNDSSILLTDDGRFVILLGYQHDGSQFQVFCVELATGTIAGTYVMREDKIHCNIHLYKDKLAILSLKHQHFIILQVGPDGKLAWVNTIGEFCHASDKDLVDETEDGSDSSSIPALKHRLLVALWKNCGNSEINRLNGYYRNWNVINNLKMFSFQFLDEDTLLIMYFPGCEPRSVRALYAIYNIKTTEIEAIFDSDSNDFRDFVIANFHYFILPTLNCRQASRFNMSNTSVIQTQLKLLVRKKSWAMKDAYYNFLPLPCQRVHSSPYLDSQQFVWPIEQVPIIDCHFTRSQKHTNSSTFLSLSGEFKFRLHKLNTATSVVSYVFHPFDPLIISNELYGCDCSQTLHFHSSTM